jgi:hypothetical protein
VGESFKHQKVLRHANSQLYWTTKLLQSDGTFRIVLFAGNIGQRVHMNRVKKFATSWSPTGKVLRGTIPHYCTPAFPTGLDIRRRTQRMMPEPVNIQLSRSITRNDERQEPGHQLLLERSGRFEQSVRTSMELALCTTLSCFP